MPGTDRGFDSLDALRAEHARLLKFRATDPADGGPRRRSRAELEERIEAGLRDDEPYDLARRIAAFLPRARATGRRLDLPADREAAQGLLDYWTATLLTLDVPRSVGAGAMPGTEVADTNLVLDDFDGDSVRAAAAAADSWVEAQAEKERGLVRRVLMRLVELPAEGRTAAPVAVPRETLWRLGTSSAVDGVLNALEKTGVVRRSGPGDSFTLRHESLTREWPRLADWVRQRVSFRDAVRYWDANGRARSALVRDDLLADARGYHDLNSLESEFLEESRVRARKQDRLVRFVIAVVLAKALVAVVALSLACWWWWRAATAEGAKRHAEEVRRQSSEQAADLERLRRAEVEEKAALERESTAAVALILIDDDPRAAEVARMVLVIQTLGQVLFADSAASHEMALLSWYRLTERLSSHGTGAPAVAEVLDEFAGELRRALRTYPADQAARQTMLNLSQAFRSRIEEGGARPHLAALQPLKPIWYAQVGRLATALAESARQGRPFVQTTTFTNLCWRLYYGELVLVESRDVAKVMVDFGRDLQEWKTSPGGVASQDLAATLTTDAGRLVDLARAAAPAGASGPAAGPVR